MALAVCLWGNSTDLSLLIDMTEEDIKKLQSTGGEHLSATEKNILGNDLDKITDKVASMKGGRIDFVLDNAGFELYCDVSRCKRVIVAVRHLVLTRRSYSVYSSSTPIG